MAGFVFKMMRSGCSSAMSQLTGCVNMVQSLVAAPMKGIIQSVTDGVWIGDGATAFVNEVQSLVMPGVGKVGEQVGFMSSNIGKAVETINQAETQAKSKISALADQFGSIYSG